MFKRCGQAPSQAACVKVLRASALTGCMRSNAAGKRPHRLHALPFVVLGLSLEALWLLPLAGVITTSVIGATASVAQAFQEFLGIIKSGPFVNHLLA